MPALEDEEPPPRSMRGGRGRNGNQTVPLTTHLSRYPHLVPSHLRTRTPSPEPWSDSDVPHDEEEGIDLLRYSGRPKPRRRLREGWITILGFKLPLPLFIMFLFPPTAIIVSLLVRWPSSLPHLDSLPVLSNGTHEFHPTTILVSIDGFRPDYLETRARLVPNLLSMGKAGLRAKSMQPIFPTLTFPNHWAMLTGLYAESHGIVANDFWAPDIRDDFSSRKQSSLGPKWWWGEPMWSVAERGGRRSAQMMWPSPQTTSNGVSPSFFVQYKRAPPLEKVTQIMEYLNMPLDDAPSLILTYLPDVDVAGHAGGPESDKVEAALERVDEFVGVLRASLEERNLTHVVDLVVVSDHGMMETSKERLVFLDDILGDAFEDIEHRDGWPSFGLRFKDQSPVDKHYETLKAAAAANGSFAVYTHDTMPERWHFSHGLRVAPFYLVPSLGWVITDHVEYDSHGGDRGELSIKGAHGYDNEFAEMQAIFFAQGPWAERMKAASKEIEHEWESTEPPVLKPFRNLELFNLIMRLQSLEDIAPPNNGTRGFWDKYM